MTVRIEAAEFDKLCESSIVWRVKVPSEDRSNPSDDIAEEYAVEFSAEIPGGCIIWGLYRGAWHANVSARYLVSKLLKLKISGERLPQRFRYRKPGRNGWDFGVCIPRGNLWSVQAGTGYGSFKDDPWEIVGHIIGDVDEFEWIDNDYGWSRCAV